MTVLNEFLKRAPRPGKPLHGDNRRAPRVEDLPPTEGPRLLRAGHRPTHVSQPTDCRRAC